MLRYLLYKITTQAIPTCKFQIYQGYDDRSLYDAETKSSSQKTFSGKESVNIKLISYI